MNPAEPSCHLREARSLSALLAVDDRDCERIATMDLVEVAVAVTPAVLRAGLAAEAAAAEVAAGLVAAGLVAAGLVAAGLVAAGLAAEVPVEAQGVAVAVSRTLAVRVGRGLRSPGPELRHDQASLARRRSRDPCEQPA
jgi:hypothetical protein